MFNEKRGRMQRTLESRRNLVLSLSVLLFFCLLLWLVKWTLNWIDPSNASDRIDLMTGAAQIIGGFALLLGLFFTYKSLQNSQRTLELAQRSQASDRFFTAVEQLGSSSIDVRAGAVYALGMIAEDSDQHYEQSIEVIVRFLRRITSSKTITQETIELGARGDVQAVITTLARRRAFPLNGMHGILNLSGLVMEGYDFHGGWFQSCDFTGCRLRGSNFSGAILHDACFAMAECIGCHFDGAGMIDTRFVGTQLCEATFHDPTPNATMTTRLVSGGQTPYKRLEFLDESSYDDVKQHLGSQGHRLRHTRFHDAILKNTYFYNTSLSEAFGLTGEQVAEARTDGSTQLPDPLPSQAQVDKLPRIVLDRIYRPKQ